ncbi:hypothetical protein TTHERM_01553990 (macronuclear) [Tetrahymena thermophila SB210]|uniref:Transmembrane protein n=1 Tax=Tetrahymena thermophila (strain SB210) TaxID=312017 RepID=Q228J5_TETTS|nr:hypothetical protein TTHERM_01553990 [Tetrahymena thermophila SB210]EAR81712.2 hypothetical protein TTHERM_01553990 [Tetrahymena thermophila SB210]|eukprot:XP_001029375.2 hypothetical protein TTHERM_01553990 [Tetrahymena thermophila SB210]
MTMIKNNKALIGGGLRIVQTNQKKLLLPQNFPFSNNIFENKAEIYGDDSTSYLQNIIIKNNDNTNEESFTFYQNQSSVPKKFQNDYSRYAELRQFRSGGLINFKMYIVDEQNRYLSFSNEKLILGLYPKDIDQELNTIQISIYQLNSTESQMFGQNTINYFQYNSLDYSFEMNEITVIGNLNKVQFFYINSTIQTNSLTKQPILLSIEFRNCKLGEVIQQISINASIAHSLLQCAKEIQQNQKMVFGGTIITQMKQQSVILLQIHARQKTLIASITVKLGIQDLFAYSVIFQVKFGKATDIHNLSQKDFVIFVDHNLNNGVLCFQKLQFQRPTSCMLWEFSSKNLNIHKHVII